MYSYFFKQLPAHALQLNSSTYSPIQQISRLTDANIKRIKPQDLGWDWGEGLFLYALLRLDKHLKQTKYQSYVKTYFEHHLKKGIPDIDWSDKCVPGLPALELFNLTKDEKYLNISKKIVNYIKQTPPTKDGGLNHLGTFSLSYVYPESMWVDSLMMYNIFAAHWGDEMNDPALLQFASNQPLYFAKVLHDKNENLWKHAWKTKSQENIPDEPIFWLRGNGWVVASIPEVLDRLKPEDIQYKPLQSILEKTVKALLYYQEQSGLWHTVINKSSTYLETSGSALIAYGILHSIHKGYLSDIYAPSAQKAYFAVLDKLEMENDGLSMTEISGPTMPYGLQGYSLIPRGKNITWGLASIILAGIAYEEYKKDKIL